MNRVLLRMVAVLGDLVRNIVDRNDAVEEHDADEEHEEQREIIEKHGGPQMRLRARVYVLSSLTGNFLL